MAEETRRRLGDYEILGHIGDGAQGKIFKAQCIVDNNAYVPRDGIVAIKVVRRFGDDDKGEDRFKREIKNLINLKHPNIVEYKEAFTFQDELSADIQCLVMEFLEGEDLSTRLNDFPKGLPFEQVKSIFEQALSGLAFAREKGLIHRDLKPANIFLLSSGVVKVIDFGIARKEDGTVTTTAGFKGTYDYMAPDFLTTGEDFRGDEMSDVFSMGICLYKCLTGHLPYPTSKETGWLAYLNRWQRDNLKDLSIPTGPLRILNDRAALLIRKSLKVDRTERYGSFKEMLDDLRKVERCSFQVDSEKYELESYLGKGGFGEVFKARRVRDGKPFAVKHMFPGLDPSRFRREARLLEKYPHPNLVAYEGFTTIERLDGEDHYLILEYLEGMPQWGLRGRIKSGGAIDKQEVVKLFIGYLTALDFLHTAHRKPILHRDITPANLYAPPQKVPPAERRDPKMFDLGIARSEQTMTGGHVPGNPEYMAPEFVLEPDFRGSVQSDIFCLGMCMYEALTGRPAYDRLSRETAEMWSSLKARADGRVGISFDHDVFRLNPTFEKIVRKAISRNPKNRFQSAREMIGVLESVGTPEEGAGLAAQDDEAANEEVAATVFVPEDAAAQALDAATFDKKRQYGRRIGLAVVAVAVLVGIGVMLFKARGSEQAAVDEMTDCAQKAAEFHPTASYIQTLHRFKERGAKLKARFRTSAVLEQAMGRINVLWDTAGGKFESAFSTALDRNAIQEAAGILTEWKASQDIRVSGGMAAVDHKARALSMEGRLAFATELSALQGKAGVVTPALVLQLNKLLQDADRRESEEPVPSVKPWWDRKRQEVRTMGRSLPENIREALVTALGKEMLTDAEGVARAWVDLLAMESAAEIVPADKRQELGARVSEAVVEALNKRERVAIAAYSTGNMVDGDAMSEWLYKARESAPTIVRLSGEGYDQALKSIVDAQCRHVETLVAGIPRIADESGVKEFGARMTKIRDLFVKWSRRWPASETERLRQGVVKRCLEGMGFFGDEAIRLYGASKYKEGNQSQQLVKDIRERIPAEFNDSSFDVLQQNIARAHDSNKQQDKEVSDALAEVDRLFRMVSREDVDAWPAGLGRWGAVTLSKDTRETVERTENWQKVRREMEQRLRAWLDGKEDSRSLLAAQGVLNMDETRNLLGENVRDQLTVRLRLREDIIREKTRLDNILATLRNDDPDVWKKAVEDLAKSRQSESFSQKAVWEYWSQVCRTCLDKIKGYANQAVPPDGREERLKTVADILQSARKGNVFDPKDLGLLDEYVAAEITRIRQAPRPEVAVTRPLPPVQPVVPVQPVTPPVVTPPAVTPPAGVEPVAPPRVELSSLAEGMASVDHLLKASRVREAAKTLYDDLPYQALELAQKDKRAVNWATLLIWVKKQREDYPGLDIAARGKMDRLEQEIQTIGKGGELPERLKYKAMKAPGGPVKGGKVSGGTPRRLPPPQLSAALTKDLAPYDDLLRAGRHRDAVKQMTQRLIRSCERSERADPKGSSWDSVLDWIRFQRQQYPELDTVGKSEMDALEGRVQGLSADRTRRR